jgi:transcriptional antiterminator
MTVEDCVHELAEMAKHLQCSLRHLDYKMQALCETSLHPQIDRATSRLPLLLDNEKTRADEVGLFLQVSPSQ